MARTVKCRSGPVQGEREAGFHYETSNEFFRLWLDPTMTYSCAWFENGSETLEEAQMAKVDRAFHKVGLVEGQRLLDVGCGWGAAAERAVVRYGASAVGLTLSERQLEWARGRERPGLPLTYRLESWETYREPCDAIVSFGAFEHFTVAKYDAFFARCRELLPPGGRMLVQTITIGRATRSMELLRFGYFVYKELFHGGELPRPEVVVAHARLSGFELLHAESMRQQYVTTIERWLANLEARRDAAVAATSPELYGTYVRYLTGSARYFCSPSSGSASSSPGSS